MARRKNWSAEQIVAKLRQIEIQMAQGKSLALACKEAEISDRAPGRVPEARDLLQLAGGAGRDWSVVPIQQPHSSFSPDHLHLYPEIYRRAVTHSRGHAVRPPILALVPIGSHPCTTQTYRRAVSYHRFALRPAA
jgi:hypothetical protein